MKPFGVIGLLASALLAGPVLAASPCEEKCSDLPRYQQQIDEQQFLHDAFKEFTPAGAYLICKDNLDLQTRVKAKFDVFLNAVGKGGVAAGYIGTDFEMPGCPLMEYELGPDGKNIPDKDGQPKRHPLDENKWRKATCRDFPDAFLAHERQHQKTCKNAQAAGKKDAFQNCNFYAADDVAAYQAGIDALKEGMRKLARQCGWDPSRKDNPSKSDLDALSKNTKRAADDAKKGRKP